MEKITRLFLTTTLLVLSIVVMAQQSPKTLAQIRGQGTEPFFDRGNQQIEQEIQRLQTQQEQNLEQKDQTLEIEELRNIDRKNPENSQGEESVPSSDVDFKIPESPPQNK